MDEKTPSEFVFRDNWPAPGAATFRGMLEHRAKTDPDHKICIWDGGCLTIGELNAAANRLANALIALGAKHGDIVGVMMDQHVEHIVVVYACAKIGLVRLPINTAAKGDYLSLLLSDAAPQILIAEEHHRDLLQPALKARPVSLTIWNGATTGHDLKTLIAQGEEKAPTVQVSPDDLFLVTYTSGTTGAPKKFSRTGLSMQVGVFGSLIAADMTPGDVLLLWEPLFHGAGGHVVLAACVEKVTLAMTGTFSASRFWNQVRQFNVTKIHYIGGILPILLKQPEQANDTDHKVSIAWGGGCPLDVWEEFERRFNVRINEGYGLTEVANFVSVNRGGPRGSIGRALPFFDIRVVDDGNDMAAGQIGQIIVRGKRPEYTSKSLNSVIMTIGDRWILTGDLGRFDADGYLYFAGRKTDSMRRRGENVSAWEVERVIGSHPAVEECALIAVPSGLGDDDLKIFIKLREGQHLAELDLIKWCEDRMPYFQIPRYVAFVKEFPKTPSQRIRKGELSKLTTDCWDLQSTDYKLRR